MAVCVQDLKDPKFLHFENRWSRYYFILNEDLIEGTKEIESNPSQSTNIQIHEPNVLQPNNENQQEIQQIIVKKLYIINNILGE